MFERFTERARQVMVLAQEEARTLKHDSRSGARRVASNEGVYAASVREKQPCRRAATQ